MEWTARIVLVSCFSVPVRFSFSYIGYHRNVLDWVWKIGYVLGSVVVLKDVQSAYPIGALIWIS